MRENIILIISGFIGVFLFTPLTIVLAKRFGITDNPGNLKIHNKPIPYLGGIAIFISLALTEIFFMRLEKELYFPIQMLLIFLAALLIGAVDDIKGVSPLMRLLLEIVIGIFAFSSSYRFHNIPYSLSFVLTLLVIVGTINAVNWMDGMDGIVSGISLIVFFGFYLLGISENHPWIPRISLTLIGALAAFLIFNFYPAKIFLGDAGSYFLGTIISIMFIELSKHSGLKVFLASGTLFSLFVFDASLAIIRRAKMKKPLFEGDRSHIYDQIFDRGSSTVMTALKMYGLGICTLVVALVVYKLSSPYFWIFWLAAVVIAYSLAIILGFIPKTNK